VGQVCRREDEEHGARDLAADKKSNLYVTKKNMTKIKQHA
jgi:hypothetical protein